MNFSIAKGLIGRNVRKILLELTIVFFGVFLAFQLNNYRDEVLAKRTRKNYYRLILKDFEALQREVSQHRDQIRKHLDTFQREVASGSRPEIITLRRLDLTTNMMILRSAFSSGYLENLDAEYVSNLSSGSNYLTRVGKLLDHYNESIERSLAFHDYRSEAFYSEKGELFERYGWIIKDLEYIDNYLMQLSHAIEVGAIPDTRRLIEQ